MGIGIFGPKNGAMPKIHYATHISRILLGCFTAVGDSTVSWKFGPNSPSQSLVRARWNFGPKKENVGLKKIQWVEGNIVRLKFTQKNLAKHWFDTIRLFSLIVLVYTVCNRSCPENRFFTITHCLLHQPFQIIFNIYIQDQNSIFNRQSVTWGNQ